MNTFLADALVVAHLLFVGFVMAGGFLLPRWPRLAGLHLPAALWGAWIEFSGGICPLTPLENRLRAEAGEAGYRGGFVEHYLLPVLYPAELTPALQQGLGWSVLAVNAVAYALALRAWRRRARRP
ncbi:MAG: DUF2784 domain-containing protein [Gammaproteobacteria bacterium]